MYFNVPTKVRFKFIGHKGFHKGIAYGDEIFNSKWQFPVSIDEWIEKIEEI